MKHDEIPSFQLTQWGWLFWRCRNGCDSQPLTVMRLVTTACLTEDKSAAIQEMR